MTIEKIALDTELLAEARRLLPAVTAAAAPCGLPGIIAALKPLASVYGWPAAFSAGDEATTADFWTVYREALGDLPWSAILAGCEAYNRASTSEFFPRPGPLRALCEAKRDEIHLAAFRLAKAVEAGRGE